MAGTEPHDEAPKGPTVRAEYRIDAVRQVAAGIAHEFANALTAIAGIAYLMRGEGTCDQQARDDLDEIQKITEEAAFLARELMVFAAGRPAERGRRRLVDIVKQLRRMLPHVLPTGIRISERLTATESQVWADPQQITEIAVLLAVHARERMPDGGELTVQTREEHIVGLAAARLAMRAGPYAVVTITSSLPAAGGPQGSAVTADALAEAARILGHTGGGLGREDDAAGGSIFTIYLPIATESPTQHAPAGPIQAGTETILLLEDEDELADVISRVLQLSGYTVLHAGDGDAALHIAGTFDGTIHLLLSDVVVPGPNGLDLLRRFRALRAHTRVLFMSGYAHGLGDGVPFLAKPFPADALSQKVREVLDADVPTPER